ncbi:putative glycosyl hydrolase [Phaeomoniella chlamydospora]|uniref:Putative glycosyl hydrolase n=1 Tax=Phaeomoniella chlamydospora TaxID=158046 RepID=A0A0G2GJ64_PHACM|nr:putative glycosyl hydrolase [Phaeomoniella chlamydospora]
MAAHFKSQSSLRPSSPSKMSLLADPVSFFNSFSNSYYITLKNGSSYWAVNNYLTGTSDYVPTRAVFWTQVETIEVTEDYAEYYTSNTSLTKTVIPSLISGLNNVVSGSSDFTSWNDYNDDIMWSVIALVRAYELSDDPNFLRQAQQQFDNTYSRGFDDDLNGGLWWNTDNETKNACVNGPAAIAAQLLANNILGGDYHSKAVKIFTWLRNTLFNDTTGAIYDHIEANGTLATFSFTYNQGTFIGAATLLSQTGDTSFNYLSDASLAFNFTSTSLSSTIDGNAILSPETTDPNEGNAPGFKGIFTRWASRYIEVSGDKSAKAFLVQNANQVWNIKDKQGITWTNWTEQTPDSVKGTVLNSWGASSAVSAVVAAARVS